MENQNLETTESKEVQSEELVQNPNKPPKKRKLRQRLIDATHSKHGKRVLYFITFIESAFFPIPPDFLVVPMVVAKPESWKKLGIWVSFWSILGSFLGYFIGAVLFASVGHIIIETYSLQDEMLRVGEFYNNNAFWSLVVAAFTPLPYKVFTIAAGVFQVNLVVFAIASIIGRGARYMLVTYIAHVGGNKAFWNYLRKLKRSTWVAIIVAVLIIVGLIIWK